MNAFRNPFLLLLVICSVFFVKCSCTDETEEPETIIEKISKVWKIQTLTVGGQVVTDNTGDFSLTLNKDADNNPTTYTLNFGGLVYNFAPTSGSWSVNNLTAPTQITFAGQTISLLAATETSLKLQYTATEEQDKNTPVVVFDLVPR